jgi:hypothetical protein
MAAHHFAPCVQSDNRNKLRIALALIGAIAGVVNKPVRVLFDSWFMRAGLVLPLLRRGIHVIAQARIDTALLFPPRSRTGPAWPASKVWRTAEQGGYRGTAAIELTMRLYGKEQRVRLRSTTALARFLKGLPVHGRVVPVIRRAAADMDKGPPDRCHGKRSGRANDRPAVRAPMGYRTAGSQPEAVVGLEPSLAAHAHRARAADPDPLVRMELDAIAQPGCRRRHPMRLIRDRDTLRAAVCMCSLIVSSSCSLHRSLPYGVREGYGRMSKVQYVA